MERTIVLVLLFSFDPVSFFTLVTQASRDYPFRDSLKFIEFVNVFFYSPSPTLSYVMNVFTDDDFSLFFSTVFCCFGYSIACFV